MISPEGEHIPISIKLEFKVTNNVAEYEACLHGLKSAIKLRLRHLRVFGDSSLIINHITGNWKIYNETLALYQEGIDKLDNENFDEIEFTHLPREENQFADYLSILASLNNIPHHLRSMLVLTATTPEPGHIGAI